MRPTRCPGDGCGAWVQPKQGVLHQETDQHGRLVTVARNVCSVACAQALGKAWREANIPKAVGP